MKIIECIPNFSEGRDTAKINEIVKSLAGIEGVRLLDTCTDYDHNRFVVTFIGDPEGIENGAEALCDKALELIDMRIQKGVHPRIGAVDVVPFVPIHGVTVEEAVAIARRFGRRLAAKHNLPVYFYGQAACSPERVRLAAIRKGQYEELIRKIQDPQWLPDAGPVFFNAESGATAVGVRKPLIAFNINLATPDCKIAQNIAGEIRQSNGGLKHLQAIGVLLASRNIAQVSMNLTDYEVTSLKQVFDTVKLKAASCGVAVLESELVGLIPRDALRGVSPEYLLLKDFHPERIIENNL